MGQTLKIGIFYDGNYFARISGYYNYDHRVRQHISIKDFHKLVEQMVAERRNVDPDNCCICDAHLFRGRYSALEAKRKDTLYSDRVFDEILTENNVQLHYRIVVEGREKGIDSLFSITAFELSQLKVYDVVVLLTGDGDFVTLVQKLRGLGCKTMLLCWDYTSTKKETGESTNSTTSPILWKAVDYPVQMHTLIEQGLVEQNKLVLRLFGMSSIPNKAESGKESTDPPPLPRITGKINLVNGEKGFIRYQNRQVTFSRDNTNLGVPFSSLKAGDRVEFSVSASSGPGKKKEATHIVVLHNK